MQTIKRDIDLSLWGALLKWSQENSHKQRWRWGEFNPLSKPLSLLQSLGITTTTRCWGSTLTLSSATRQMKPRTTQVNTNTARSQWEPPARYMLSSWNNDGRAAFLWAKWICQSAAAEIFHWPDARWWGSTRRWHMTSGYIQLKWWLPAQSAPPDISTFHIKLAWVLDCLNDSLIVWKPISVGLFRSNVDVM